MRRFGSFRIATFPKLSIRWVDALYKKVRVNDRIVSIAVLVVCGADENGHRDIIAVEPMAEESEDSYKTLYENLKERGMAAPRLVISDAHAGLTAAIRKSFPGASLQRCKVHFMRNIPAHIPKKDKKAFAAVLKEIWLAPSAEIARKRANDLIDTCAKRFPKAVPAWKAVSRTRCPSTVFRIWMPGRSHPPI